MRVIVGSHVEVVGCAVVVVHVKTQRKLEWGGQEIEARCDPPKVYTILSCDNQIFDGVLHCLIMDFCWVCAMLCTLDGDR